jgi:hypothetical protein
MSGGVAPTLKPILPLDPLEDDDEEGLKADDCE